MDGQSLVSELKPRRVLDSLNLAHAVMATLILLNTAFLLYRNDCPGRRGFATTGFFFALGWVAYLTATSVVEFKNPAVQRMVASGNFFYLFSQVALAVWGAAIRCGSENVCGAHWTLWLDTAIALGALTASAIGSHLFMTLLRHFNRSRFASTHPHGVRVDHPEDYGLGAAESYLAY